MDAAAFARLPEEISLRLLGRSSTGPGTRAGRTRAARGSLFVFARAIHDASLTPPGPGSFAAPSRGHDHAFGAILTVERAPPRRTGAKARKSGPRGHSPKAA